METSYPAAIGTIEQFVLPDRLALEGSGRIARRFREVANTLARTNIPVVIVGEVGSGADALAYSIHSQSEAANAPFTIIDCATAESSLFASGTKEWRGSPLASAGTVVLKRVGELSQKAQVALAEMLAQPERVHKARLLVCTEKDLAEELRKGRIREDLACHFGHVFVRVPPLRERREDIIELADSLIDRYASLFEKPRPVMGPQLKKVLLDLSWPSNLRDLEAAAKMIVLVGDERVSLAALRSSGTNGKGTDSVPAPLKETARAASRAAEREVIQKVLTRSGGNRKATAKQLQISYKALLYKLKQFGLNQKTNRGNL